MATPLAALARLLLRSSAAAAESLDAAAAHAFGLEAVLNRCIGDSTRAGELLEGLDGRSLAIIVTGLGICLRLQASKTHLALSAASVRSDTTATATVEGTPLILLGLLGSAGSEGFRNSGARLSGDAPTAEAFAELLRHARPDMEEELSKLIGDIPAHEIAGAARRTDAFARRAGSALTMNASEFLQEEARQLPPRVEVDAFGQDVERLRDDVERAAQRLARLETHRRSQPSRSAGADATAERG